MQRYRPGLFYSVYHFVLSHLITEKIKKNDWQNWNFQNCFPHISWKPVQKIKVYIFEKISSRTVLKYLPFCSILYGYVERKKKWLTKLKFPKLLSSYFMNACSKKKKFIFLQRYRPGLFYSLYHFVLSHLIMEKIKKIDWQNWNFQNCFTHISWKPVPKKNKRLYFCKDIV